MNKNIVYFSLLLLTFCSKAFAYENSLWKGVKQTGILMLQGSKEQFTTSSNLKILAVGLPSTWWAFEEDQRLSNHYMREELKSYVNFIGDAGVFFNFPVATISTWYLGRFKGNKKLQEFAKETAATTYISLAESGILSWIQIHKRPSSANLSSWETDLRGDSSFPSGHIIPYAALFWKTLQFYGPYWSAIPLGLTWISGRQRLEDGKHYASDLIASFFMSGFASEGVRIANNHKDNHPFYKWIFEHEARIGLLRHRRAIGPYLVWKF